MSGATDAAAPACGLGAKGRCVPCESLDKSHVLSQDAVEKELAESLNMWKLKPLDGGANGKGDDAECWAKPDMPLETRTLRSVLFGTKFDFILVSSVLPFGT